MKYRKTYIIQLVALFLMPVSFAFATSYEATGFGSASANGVYTVDGTFESCDHYTNGTWYLYVQSGSYQWNINSQSTYSGPTNMYYKNTGTCDPSADPYIQNSGDAPAGEIHEYTGPPPAPPFVASSGNTYTFLVSSVAIFLMQLFIYLTVLYIVFVIIGWPIKYMLRAMRGLIRRSGR